MAVIDEVKRPEEAPVGKTRSIVTKQNAAASESDAYFSADVETDGPIPGPYSMLSLGLVYCGSYDGVTFERPKTFNKTFYCEIKPISSNYEQEALDINRLDREKLLIEGSDPQSAMNAAFDWIEGVAGGRKPVLVAYPVSFDWTWLFWYFTAFCKNGSPFNYSRCYDLKTAISVKSGVPINKAGRSRLPWFLRSAGEHTHNALEDAIEQAEIFTNVFEWKANGKDR